MLVKNPRNELTTKLIPSPIPPNNDPNSLSTGPNTLPKAWATDVTTLMTPLRVFVTPVTMPANGVRTLCPSPRSATPNSSNAGPRASTRARSSSEIAAPNFSRSVVASGISLKNRRNSSPLLPSRSTCKAARRAGSSMRDSASATRPANSVGAVVAKSAWAMPSSRNASAAAPVPERASLIRTANFWMPAVAESRDVPARDAASSRT